MVGPSRQRVALCLLVALVLGSALALGAIHTEVLAACAIAACAAALLSASRLDELSLGSPSVLLLCVSLGLTLWTALQLVPLPIGLLGLFARENADVWARSLRPLHDSGPAFAPISVDPTATRVQVLRGLTYLATLLAALPVAERREGRTLLQRVVIFATAMMAAAAVAHPALDLHKVFLIYEPKERSAYEPAHIAPLLNLNHLSAYVNIGALLALPSAFERRHEAVLPRPVAVVLVLLLGATTVWTGSRGGFATLVTGSILVAVLSLRRRGRGKSTLAMALVAIAVVSVLLLSSFDTTRSKLSTNNLAKLDIVRKSLELLHDYGAVGAGRGTFESVFPKIREGTEYFVYTHPENLLAQWTTEWGVPVALAGIAALLWALRPQRLFIRTSPPIGAWAAIVAVAAHNLVDFSGEIPGVVIALTVCAAVVTGGNASEIDGERPRSWQIRRRVLSIVGVCAVGLFTTVAFLNSDHELHNERRAFTALALDRALSREQFRERVRVALLRHPADPYFAFVGAVRAAVARDESLLPWAAHALERSRTYGRVHLLIARSLHTKNRAQARLEYRLACSQDALACAVPEMLPLVGSFEEARELVPDGTRGVIVLEFLIESIERRLPASAARLEHELISRSPAAPGPARHAALSNVSDLLHAEPWCAGALRTACITEGLQAARSLVSATPDRCDGYALSATLRTEAGDPNGAFDEFEGAVPLVEDRSRCAQRLLELARRTRDNGLITRAISKLENVSCSGPDECAGNLMLAARAESGRGNRQRSLVLLRRAWERSDSDSVLEEIASTAEAQGLLAQAIDAYTKLAARHPSDPKWKAGVDRTRAADASRRLKEPSDP